MPIKAKLIDSGLCGKGFIKDDRHHLYYIYETIDGKKSTIKTKMSHNMRGSSDIDDNLVSAMARQCRLKISDFKKLIECPLSRDEYEEILRNADRL